MKIIQQGVWHMSRESMPLAAGYLAAAVQGDPELSERCRVEILNYSGATSPWEMATRLLDGDVPDVLCFSVLGWNVRQFGALAETFKQVNPNGVVVFGGNHVSHQADRTLRQWPEVDVIVNGEGELTLVDLLSRIADGGDLAEVEGISYRDAGGVVRSTADRARIENLDIIPSPILSGVLPLHDDTGAFRYDVALLETNRGCPYHCSFCYWGGAVGQRVRSFSRERLRAELEALARAKAETVVLCDANFGILAADLEFVRDLVEVRRRHGYPRALETSWAKNKSKTFYEIVDIMRREGIRSSFTLALQTLSDDALATMNRRNMRINAWRDLTERLSGDGMDIYAELIWGAPGETPESFLAGYDELARHVSRIAAYPLILLPNTDYAERKDLYGFVTVRGDRDDFEYVLANKDMTLRQNLDMQRFLFWARLLAENLVLRRVFPALRASGGVRQSRVILSIADHIEAQPGPGARLLHRAAANSTADPDSLSPALEFCFISPEFDDLVRGWWQANGSSLVAAEWLEPLAELIRFDLDSRPLPDAATRGLHGALAEVRDGEAVIIAERDYAYDVLDMCHGTAEGRPSAAPRRGPVRIELTWKAGFAELAASTNHEETAHYVAGSRRLDGARLPAVAH
ncbi:KedN5 family methylcobalamin-dependent radical SAM C-methyltransferase [Streptomyces sp. NRRL S-31]|uniref:KedN5 family methylcobalamin-dependent radical SAM C-methyltransferase n=1 Tax=Streptomyces sp. NRRL S-31 TaxID=1463898 RepID=UPI000B287524|nr:KedN5 family methylcobalamin-dependent radical SAM C-methyltransferase [Streptomyces sp. NRRL S-31]